MKMRYQEGERCLALIDVRRAQAGGGYRHACKQLYHDMEEVTVYLRR